MMRSTTGSTSPGVTPGFRSIVSVYSPLNTRPYALPRTLVASCRSSTSVFRNGEFLLPTSESLTRYINVVSRSLSPGSAQTRAIRVCPTRSYIDSLRFSVRLGTHFFGYTSGTPAGASAK